MFWFWQPTENNSVSFCQDLDSGVGWAVWDLGLSRRALTIWHMPLYFNIISVQTVQYEEKLHILINNLCSMEFHLIGATGGCFKPLVDAEEWYTD